MMASSAPVRRQAKLSVLAERLSPARLSVPTFLAAWMFFVILPLLVLVVFSFFQVRSYRIVYELSFDTWQSLIDSGRWMIALRTLRVAVTMTVIELLLAFPFALWLAKGCRSKTAKATIITLLTIPFFLDAASRIIIWRAILGTNGMINTALMSSGLVDEPVSWLLYSEFAVHFGMLGASFPTMVFPIFIIISLIDDSYLNASDDLGASPVQTLVFVILPMALPGILAGIIFTFVPLMAAYVEPQLLGGGFVDLLGNSVDFGLAAAPLSDGGSTLDRGGRPACPLSSGFHTSDAQPSRPLHHLLGAPAMSTAALQTGLVDESALASSTRFIRRASRWKVWPGVAKTLGFLAIAAIYIPLIWLAVMSFSESPLSGIPYPLTMANYAQLAGDERWAPPLQTSIWMSGLVALVCMIVATMVGRAITRMRRPGPVLLLTLLPLFVPGLTMGAALFIFLRIMMGLTLGLWSIFVAQLIWALPFSLLLVLVVASRFDLRLLEAAEDLGASPWRRFWEIEMPLLRPGILGAGIFGYLLSFNELLRSLFVRGVETTMPIYNWAMAASQQSQVPIIFSLSAIMLFVTLPIMGALFWFLFVKLDRD